MNAVLQPIGRTFLSGLESAGRLFLFAVKSLLNCVQPPFYPRHIVRQMIEIGYYSLPVVGMTAIFTGMVLALQSYTGFSRFNAESCDPERGGDLALTRELGPVLAGLIVAGRIGAAMAAEIGTMRVTEQIDALSTLSTNPYKYLVAPRLIAGLTMMPLLVLVADIIGVFGGYVVSIYKLGFNPASYLKNTVDFVEPLDVISGLVKAAVFGFIIALMGCYHGFHSRGGAQGVGKATTNAVVTAIDPDPDLQLHHHRAVFRPMSADSQSKTDLKIKVRGLKKAFGSKVVLNGVDLDVPRDQSLVVIGGSGTGKSVLIKCILGLLQPDSGSIEIDGEEVVGASAEKREAVMQKFGMLFQGGALFDSLPGLGKRRLRPDRRARDKRREAKDVALRKLAAVGLGPEVGELSPAELSGGMQKRVALARAIAVEPEIIFFDEPTTGLDPIMADVINELIIEMRHRPRRHRALDHP